MQDREYFTKATVLLLIMEYFLIVVLVLFTRVLVPFLVMEYFYSVMDTFICYTVFPYGDIGRITCN